MSSKSLFVFGLLAVVIFSGYWFTVQKNVSDSKAPPAYDKSTMKTPSADLPNDAVTKRPEIKMAEPVVADVDSFVQAEDIVHAMKPNGMDEILSLFPDLEVVDTIMADDPRNLLEQNPEPWMYSPSSDVTVIVCTEMNTPGHVFRGKSIAQEDIDGVKKAMKEMMDDMDAMEDKGEDEEKMADTSKSSAQYVEYSADAFASHTGKQVLFFHAEWCPTCRNWEAKIKKELSNLPDGTHIVQADYDAESELKKKYGVTVQSTAVFIDENGEMVSKAGDPSVDTVREFFES